MSILLRFLLVILVSPVLAGIAAPASAAADPPPYQLSARPLGAIPGWTGSYDAKAINNLGQIVGNSSVVDGRQRTFFFDGVGMQEVGALSAINADVAGLNNLGQIVGTAGNRAFIYSGGTVTYLGDATVESGASSVNDRGQVAGWVQSGRDIYATVFENGTARRLPLNNADWSSWTNAINARGDVVGTAILPGSGEWVGFVYHASGSYSEFISSFGSTASDINDAGDVVGRLDGYAGSWAQYQAYVIIDGERHLLYPGDYQRSDALGINNRGQIVGDLGVWEPNGILYTWDTLLATLPRGMASVGLINDNGQMVGRVCFWICEPYLLNPVPEPVASQMLVAGLALMAGLIWCGRRT